MEVDDDINITDSLGTIPKWLVRGQEVLEFRGRAETTVLLKSVWILAKVRET